MKQEAISGIYKITSPTNKIYVGKSIDIERRFFYYRRCAIRTQPKLRNSIKKHGAEAHNFEIIHICKGEKEMNYWERFYIRLYDCFNTKSGLNLREGGEGCGKLSDQTKDRIAESHRGKKRKPFSDETKENMRQAQYGRKHSEETKNKMSKWQKGVKKGIPSQETRLKISLANKGKKRSEEFKLNNRRHRLGKRLSEEAKRKIGDANRGKTRSDEVKRELSEIRKNSNRVVSLETRMKISAANIGKKKGFKHSEETRQKMRHSNLKRGATGASKFKGVRGFSHYKIILNGVQTYSKWYATVTLNKKPIYLGLYNTQEEAALAYNVGAKKYHGEFANLNIID